jgi:hypothetical protein
VTDVHDVFGEAATTDGQDGNAKEERVEYDCRYTLDRPRLVGRVASYRSRILCPS